jgi:hypothetical protein
MADDETKRPTPEDMARDGEADLAVCDKGKQATWQAWVAFEKKVPRQWQQAFRPVVVFARAVLDALPAWVRRALSAEANAAHFALKYDAALGRAHAAEAERDAFAARVAELEAAR